MNQIVPQNFGQVASVFQGMTAQDDLSAGVAASFGLIGYKGKVWSIRYRGDEKPVMRPDGDGPRNSIEVVIIKASTHISKIWYEQGYTEGANQPPDCYSMNGINPVQTSRKLQSNACGICPRNQWGSRITPQGKQGKDCQDSKRLVVVPLGDLYNEMFGGPLLLRVPAASLQDLATYGTAMNKLGYPYFAIGTRIAFDPQEAYPKFVFNAIRPLSEAEAAIVVELMKLPIVDRILAEGAEHVAATPIQGASQVWEQPPQTTAAAPQPQPMQSHTTGGASTTSAPGAHANPDIIPASYAGPALATGTRAATQPAQSVGGAGGATSQSGTIQSNGTSVYQKDTSPAVETGGFGVTDTRPTTGGASTQPAQPAGSTGVPSHHQAGPSPAIPAHNILQNLNGGGAGTASAGAMNGFGGPEIELQAQPAQAPQPAPQPAPPTSSAQDFEAELDRKLANLLGTG